MDAGVAAAASIPNVDVDVGAYVLQRGVGVDRGRIVAVAMQNSRSKARTSIGSR